jgi:hypothetical protein
MAFSGTETMLEHSTSAFPPWGEMDASSCLSAMYAQETGERPSLALAGHPPDLQSSVPVLLHSGDECFPGGPGEL